VLNVARKHAGKIYDELSEKDAKLAQNVGPTSALSSCIPTGNMHGPTCIVWATLTLFALGTFRDGVAFAALALELLAVALAMAGW
jgi:hypothetical protein